MVVSDTWFRVSLLFQWKVDIGFRIFDVFNLTFENVESISYSSKTHTSMLFYFFLISIALFH